MHNDSGTGNEASVDLPLAGCILRADFQSRNRCCIFLVWPLASIEMLVTATKSMVEADDALNLFISVSNFIKLCLKKILLGSQYLKVAC